MSGMNPHCDSIRAPDINRQIDNAAVCLRVVVAEEQPLQYFSQTL
jgi:hypothetical protein